MLSEGVILDVSRNAFMTIIVTAAPPLLVSLIICLIISIFKTVKYIQEQTLTFVPKILAVFLTLMLLGDWMLNQMTDFMIELWNNLNLYIQ